MEPVYIRVPAPSSDGPVRTGELIPGVMVDFQDGLVVGIEVLDAKSVEVNGNVIWEVQHGQ